MPVHRDLTGAQVHTPITWEYDSQTEREAATGFETSDVGKLAWQKDNNSVWMLINITPTWNSFGGDSSIVTNTITDGNTDTAPSEDAVHDALTNKSDATHSHSEYATNTDLTTHAGISDAHHSKYTNAEAKSAAVNNSITDGNTDTAPSEDAVHNALADLDSVTIDFNSEYDNGTVSSNITIDWNNGNNQIITLSASIIISFSNMGIGHKQLRILQDSTGGRTVTLPSGKWPGGNVISLTSDANAEDLLSIFNNGTSYYFMMSKNWS